MIIYKITNKLNGHCYIGQTTKTIVERWAEHCLPSSKCYALSGAIKKYGKNNFSIEEVAKYSSREELGNAEEYFIGYYNCLAPNGYNLTTGGIHTTLAQVSRDKSSITHKKRIAAGLSPWLPKKGESRSPATQFKKGQIGIRLGTKLTQEQLERKKLSIKKGIHPKTEFKKGIIPWQKGKPSINKGKKGIRDASGKLSYPKDAKCPAV